MCRHLGLVERSRSQTTGKIEIVSVCLTFCTHKIRKLDTTVYTLFPFLLPILDLTYIYLGSRETCGLPSVDQRSRFGSRTVVHSEGFISWISLENKIVWSSLLFPQTKVRQYVTSRTNRKPFYLGRPSFTPSRRFKDPNIERVDLRKTVYWGPFSVRLLSIQSRDSF